MSDLEQPQPININTDSEVVPEEVVINLDEEEDSDLENEFKNQLPLSKIRRLMKTDPDSPNLITKEAVFVTTVAAELFISLLAQQAGKITIANKKKTLNLQHLKSAIKDLSSCDFLEGAIPGTDI